MNLRIIGVSFFRLSMNLVHQSLLGLRDEFGASQARIRGLKSEIRQLRGQIAKLDGGAFAIERSGTA